MKPTKGARTIMPAERLMELLRAAALRVPAARPWLLYGPEDLARVRARPDAGPATRGLLERARAARSAAGEAVNALQPYLSGAEAVDVAEALALRGGPDADAEWLHARLRALLAMDTWFSPVHQGACRVCDHVMANVAAQVAVVHDLLGPACAPAETAEIAAGLGRLFFAPFLDATGDDCEWWFRPDMASNWKIMTCGDAGLALCAFADHWPHAGEGLVRAARAVAEVLDQVPPEGDWPEGLGYWFGTLRFGLRFARALRRLTGGTVNLFDHPALRVTGDFLVLLTTPAGRLYNFNDCSPALGREAAEAMAVLAAETGRRDWLGPARAAAEPTLLTLACADPAAAPATPARTAALFPASGAAALRSGWTPDASFIGLKSGPSQAGHAHLDANSFLLEARGRRLVGEYDYWPQAHFLGFFDTAAGRWNFDGPATVGHSTLLVDGRGQSWGPGRDGRLIEARDGAGWSLARAEAGAAYPGLLHRFERTVLLLKPDAVVIRDVVVCDGERHVEWLLHPEGAVRDAGMVTTIEHDGVRLCVTPFRPDRSGGWRVSDVTRASTYECSDTRREVTRTIRYRSFAPFRRAAAFEFLFGLRVDGDEQGADWTFAATGDTWSLRAAGHPFVIRPDAGGLRALDAQDHRGA